MRVPSLPVPELASDRASSRFRALVTAVWLQPSECSERGVDHHTTLPVNFLNSIICNPSGPATAFYFIIVQIDQQEQRLSCSLESPAIAFRCEAGPVPIDLFL